MHVREQPTHPREFTITIEHWLRYYERSDDTGFWAAIDKNTNEFLGWFHFRPREGTPTSPSSATGWCRRHGARDTRQRAGALIDTGDSCWPSEPCCRRVRWRSGMRTAASRPYTVRIPGDEQGEVEYAITRAEWEASRTHP